MDMLSNLRDDMLGRTVEGLSALIAAAKSIKHEEESFGRFSDLMIDIKDLLNKQQFQRQGGQIANVYEERLLRRLEEAVNNARRIIEGYRSKGAVRRFLFSSTVDSQLNKSSDDIAEVLALLSSSHISTGLDINVKLDDIIHSLKSVKFKLKANMDAISSLDGAAGSSRVSPIETPEVQPTRLLQDSINVPPVYDSGCCPLTGKLMEDPVLVSCRHTYERNAIEEYFRSRHKFCIVCKAELSSTNGKLVLEPNYALRDNISERRLRDERVKAENEAREKLVDCTKRITLYNVESTNQALEVLQKVMTETPSCISVASESSCKLVAKLAELLQYSGGTTGAVLRCLLLIARFSDENKEIIGKRGVIKCLLKQDSGNEATAIEILLELSKNNNVAQKIIELRTPIFRLVSLLDSPSSALAEMAQAVLKNLSPDINCIIKMAMSEDLPPFLDRFNSKETSEETRAFMAEKLVQMGLTETAICCLENELFITNLSLMLDCSLPAVKLASLKCIKWLITFDRFRNWILSTGYTIFASLLCLIMDTDTEILWKHEALDILTSLIEINHQKSPCLDMVYSFNRIQDLVEQIRTSPHEDQVLLLQLLLAIIRKSETARDCVLSNEKAITFLYSSLSPDKNREVRLNALKLVHYIAGNNPTGFLLPPNPGKEEGLSHIIAILKESRTDEEISMASSIITRLPRGDRRLNLMLQSPDVLEGLKIQISNANKSSELLENALGALLRCMDQSNSEFLMQLVEKMEQSIVRSLSVGSPLAKQFAAMILADLARRTLEPSTRRSSSSHSLRSFWLPFPSSNPCTVHDSSCSLQRIVCVAKAGAVRPLVSMVDAMNPDASKAALMALHSLFDVGNDETGVPEAFFNRAASAIVENDGVAPILAVLERGTLPVKEEAFELIRKIFKHGKVKGEELTKFKAILFYLVKEDKLGNKARILIEELVREHGR